MFRTLMTSAVAALMLSGAAYAQDALTVESVTVEADLQAIENQQAASYWAMLSDDLTKAIAERVANQLGEDGTDIKIDISEVELSNGFQEAMGLAEYQAGRPGPDGQQGQPVALFGLRTDGGCQAGDAR